MGIFNNLLEDLFNLTVRGAKIAIKSGQETIREMSEKSSSYIGCDEEALRETYFLAVQKKDFKEMVAIRNRLSNDFNYSSEDFENINKF